jgi:hypothetical protein
MGQKQTIKARKIPPKSREKPISRRRVRVGKLDTIPKIADFERRLLKAAMKTAIGTGGVLSVNDAYKLSSVCTQLVKTVEAGDIEARLTALERRLNEKELR